MYITDIKNCNNELLNEQKQALINDIVFGEPADYFNVYSMEPGTGKTRTAEDALEKMVKETKHNALLVRYSNSNCDESANRINDLVGDIVALPFYNEGSTWEERTAKQKDFPQYRILVIPHQRYLQLSRDSSQRNKFTKDRDTLIIDEHINDVTELTLTNVKIGIIKKVLMYYSQLYLYFLKIVSAIEDKLMTTLSINFYLQTRLKNEISISSEINNLNKMIRANINPMKLKRILESLLDHDDIDLKYLEKISSVNKLCGEIKNIKEFYNQSVILHQGTLHVPSSRDGYWLLYRNIILNASAELTPAYTLNPTTFKIQKMEKVLDHSNWTLINIICDTTISGKERIENYYEVVNQYLVQNYDTDSMLVVGNQKEIPFIDAIKDENKIYFGNLIGSNKWSDLKNVAIIHTPNISDTDYLMMYLHNSRKRLDENEYNWITKKNGKGAYATHAFIDEKMEQIRIQFIADQIYQAVKRVNRCMDKETNVILICNNEKVVNLVREHLKGCKFQIIDDIGFIYTETKFEQYQAKRQENSHVSNFIRLLAELQEGQHQELLHRDKHNNIVQGTYRKNRLREKIGMYDKSNFGFKVLLNAKVIEYCNTRGITTKGQYIRIPP